MIFRKNAFVGSADDLDVNNAAIGATVSEEDTTLVPNARAA